MDRWPLFRCRAETFDETKGAPIPDAEKLLMPVSLVEIALRTQNCSLLSVGAYHDTVREMVLPQFHESVDRKDRVTHSKILLGQDAEIILSAIWKESRYVSEEMLRAANMARQFVGVQMTAHGLAVRLAGTAERLAAVNTKVRNVCVAAELCNLIIRNGEADATHKPLFGTETLHQLFVEIGRRRHIISLEQGQLPPLEAIDPDVPQP